MKQISIISRIIYPWGSWNENGKAWYPGMTKLLSENLKHRNQVCQFKVPEDISNYYNTIYKVIYA